MVFRACGPRASTVGTEELGHLEMVGTIVYQLTRNLTEEQIKQSGFDTYFVDHTTGVFPQFASGYPWSAATMQVTGDTIADLTEDLAADAARTQEQHGICQPLYILTEKVREFA